MKKRLTTRYVFWLLCVINLASCDWMPPSPDTGKTATKTNQLTINYDESSYQDTTLVDTVLYDKILGMLVGSAIGDAMGAPTEMWARNDISEEYGHVDSLDMVLREPSPEGPWGYNLPPGAGTDDTRWKDLMAVYCLREHDQRVSTGPLTFAAGRFADFIVERYTGSIADLKATEGLDPEPLEDAMRRLTWLQEWATVSRAYQTGEIDAYRNALARFYGGEMSCAGMLYAPMLGAVYPGKPAAAYAAAYELSLFDLGYARDISGITAALTAEAFAPSARQDSFVTVLREVDPEGFFRSRLIGRVAYQQYRTARAIVRAARRVTREDMAEMDFILPDEYPYDSLTYAQTLKAYELLAKANQDVPFHAGEIHLINLTALLFSNFKFSPAMEFITNFGRDNDTVAAVAGAILGALEGFKKLPEDQRELVLRVNLEVLDIDLRARARALTDAVVARRG